MGLEHWKSPKILQRTWDFGNPENFTIEHGVSNIGNRQNFKGGVELAKGDDISSFLSAIISIIQKKRQPRSHLSPILTDFFQGWKWNKLFCSFSAQKNCFLTKTAENRMKRITSCLENSTPPLKRGSGIRQFKRFRS
jgi:hypothetical protein